MMKRLQILTLLVAAILSSATSRLHAGWQATWATAQQLVEPGNMPPDPGFVDTTLRQTVRVSIGGSRLRVKFSNAFGDGPLVIHDARLALAEASGHSTIRPETEQPLKFGGRPSVTIPVGAHVLSDPLEFDLAPMADVAVSIHLKGVPKDVTGHPGSRTTSFLATGADVSSETMPGAVRTDHWYYLCGIDVETAEIAGAVVTLGDSLTDGRGTTTNGNNRWPDRLAARLRADAGLSRISTINMGIGGNRVLGDGLGPGVLARLDRDVIAQPGVRWLIVFEGINDIGTSGAARAKGGQGTTAADLIFGYEQVIARARAAGIRVYGATLTPFGDSFYDTPGSEEDRQAVNTWIRTSGAFDAVIDFEAAVRDPEHPTRLAAAYDTGDKLHLNPAGYEALAASIPLELFRE